MSSHDHIFDGDAAIVRVGACKDIVISATTFVSVEPSTKEFSGMHVVVDVCSDDRTLFIVDKVGDIVIESCYTIDQ